MPDHLRREHEAHRRVEDLDDAALEGEVRAATMRMKAMQRRKATGVVVPDLRRTVKRVAALKEEQGIRAVRRALSHDLEPFENVRAVLERETGRSYTVRTEEMPSLWPGPAKPPSRG